jgi:DNA-binding MurR/RpiR family transcriptional regulator
MDRNEHDYPSDGLALSAMILGAYPGLSATEKRIADLVLNFPEQLMYYSVTQVAEELSIAQSSVTRFCRTIGLRGFQELKIRIAQNTERTNPNPTEEEELSLAQTMAQTAANSILDAASYVDRVALEQTVKKLAVARKIMIFGLGESGAMAQLMKIKLLGLGLAADMQLDVHLQAMCAANLNERDVAIGISQQGSTKDIVSSIRAARASGATTVCITGQGKSPITEVSDIRLLYAQRGLLNVLEGFKSKASVLYVVEILTVMLTLHLAKQTEETNKKIWKTTESILDKLY